MPDLTEWLLQQIAHDERITDDVLHAAPTLDSELMHALPDLLTIDPTRVLAECAAKRKIIKEWAACDAAKQKPEDVRGLQNGLYYSMKTLAEPYADRPGYDETWRP
jgi:hypothetical protein